MLGGGSDNPVTFASTTPAVCTTGGSYGASVTGVAVGQCEITATPAGNVNYSQATNSESFSVSKGNSVVAITTIPRTPRPRGRL